VLEKATKKEGCEERSNEKKKKGVRMVKLQKFSYAITLDRVMNPFPQEGKKEGPRRGRGAYIIALYPLIQQAILQG